MFVKDPNLRVVAEKVVEKVKVEPNDYLWFYGKSVLFYLQFEDKKIQGVSVNCERGMDLFEILDSYCKQNIDYVMSQKKAQFSYIKHICSLYARGHSSYSLKRGDKIDTSLFSIKNGLHLRNIYYHVILNVSKGGFIGEYWKI